MTEKSHRTTRRCYRSGVEALQHTVAGRLDGYRLYNPSDLSGRWVCEVCRRPLRPAGREHRRRSEEHTSELQSRLHLVCRLLLEKKKKKRKKHDQETRKRGREPKSLA